ncbi:hypothetical protein V2G26_002898 [Clonostachys chloroleuca]
MVQPINDLCLQSGGMGLTGGLVDVGDLFDSLKGIHDGQATSDILEKMRLDPDEAEAKDPGLEMMREADKSLESSKTFQLGALGLAHDMTQWYNHV